MKANFSFMDSVLSYKTLIVTHFPFSMKTVHFSQMYYGIICSTKLELFDAKNKQFGYSTNIPSKSVETHHLIYEMDQICIIAIKR